MLATIVKSRKDTKRSILRSFDQNTVQLTGAGAAVASSMGTSALALAIVFVYLFEGSFFKIMVSSVKVATL